MNPQAPDETRLVAAVREALTAAEPAQAPPFRRVWSRATARGIAARNRRLQTALTAAAVAAAVTVAWFGWPRPSPDPQADYLLAVEMSRAGVDIPTDRWLTAAPSTPLGGLPVLPAVDYPLLPEEKFL